MSGTKTAPMQGRSVDEWVALLAIVFFGYFVVAVLALQFLRTDYNPLSHGISGYAIGPYGGIMTSAFISLSLGALFLLVGLIRQGPQTTFFRVSLLFLAVFVPGVFVAALFQVDVPGAPPTLHGRIHVLDAIFNFISIMIGIVLYSIGFGADARWRAFKARARLLALGVVAAFVIMILTPSSPNSFFGLTNKLFASLLLLWLLATSNELRLVARRQGTSN
jgi:uncharacterized protein DUF998